MILWIGVFGALIGWCLAGLEPYGFFVGGLLGAAIGWIIRRSVRAEIARATATLQTRLDALLAHDTAPSAVVTADLPARAVNGNDADDMASPPSAAPQFPAGNPLRSTSPEPARAVAPVDVPREPSVVETLLATALASAKNWMVGGNTIVRVGIVILFIGLSFLASYAASAGLFPIELRLALVGAIGIALLGVGFRTRTTRAGFGLGLQGAGIATIYLTLFTAAKLYGTFPLAAAFVLMIMACALGCALALLQRSQALAATAFTGGFAVPLLLASGGGSIVSVFVYYTILNMAILFIARSQSWRVLNLVGLFATFGMATLWGTTSYAPADYAPAQVFLILSVLIYVVMAVFHTRATPGRLGGAVDTTLLFGPALAGFGLQVGLVHHRPFGSAFAALGFAALYLGVFAWATRYRRESFRVMNEAMLAIGVGFVTLAVPLALGARWTSAAWALEGAGAFWVGLRQARWIPRAFGILLQLVAALLYLGAINGNLSAIPIANPGFVGAMLISLAGLATAWWLREPLSHSGSRPARAYGAWEAKLVTPALLFGFAFWWLAWTVEVGRSVPSHYAGIAPAPVFDVALQQLLAMLAYVVSAWGAQAIGRRVRWSAASLPSFAMLPALVMAFVGTVGIGRHVLYTPDWAIWILVIGLHFRSLYLNDRDPHAGVRQVVVRATHIGGIWLAVAMLADVLWIGIDRARLWNTAWAEVSFLAASIVVLTVLTLWAGRAIGCAHSKTRWPLDRHAVAYGWYAAIPIAALVFLGGLTTSLASPGDARPLPYVPLLNPVDLALGLTLAALELWRRTIVAIHPPLPGSAVVSGRGPIAALAGLSFVMVNTIWMRIAHQLLGVSWSGDALLASFVVQTGLAILWTLLALTLMVLASRRVYRALWLVGAGLLALTVVKLLSVDLNNVGGGARVVAFIVVGVLMLVVGYLAPLPPKGSATLMGEGRAAA